MSTVSTTTVGLPDSVITASDLNSAFSAFEVTADRDNLRVDAILNRQIVTSVLQTSVRCVSNVSATPSTYTGTSYQAITHGSNALNTGTLFVPDQSVLRVHWHQYIDTLAVTIPTLLTDVDRWIAFKLEWDIGAGYVDIPDLLVSALFPVTATSINAYAERKTHNMTGSWVWKNTTGAVVNITGIRLMVRPSDSEVLDSVDLGEGNIAFVVHNY